MAAGLGPVRRITSATVTGSDLRHRVAMFVTHTLAPSKAMQLGLAPVEHGGRIFESGLTTLTLETSFA